MWRPAALQIGFANLDVTSFMRLNVSDVNFTGSIPPGPRKKWVAGAKGKTGFF